MSLILGKGNLKKKGIFHLLGIFDGVRLFGVALDEGGENYKIIKDSVVFKHLYFFWVELSHYVKRLWNFLDLFVFVVDGLPEIAERQTQIGKFLGVSGCFWQVFRKFEVEVIIKRPLQGLIVGTLTTDFYVILTLKLVNPLALIRTQVSCKLSEVFLTHVPFLLSSDAIVIQSVFVQALPILFQHAEQRSRRDVEFVFGL